ncbi:effector-associated domain EAD1-containing protein [Chryseobacterium aquaticum]|uniref:GAP1-N1 domain-containing protein n=1 Tax=Chryseobacterium aquaticum TaxID=452084 RepID=UPI003F721A8F
MKIVIHQSICGEVNKAWGLIKTTMSDVNVAKNIAFRTDLHEQTGGVDWQPAIRGFSEGNYFLIMKTFEDISPDVRRGRKFSHVLIIPKNEIIQIDNIEQIINLLPKDINKDIALETITLEISSKKNDDSLQNKIQERFKKLINGYINIKNYKNVLIWIGQDNFSIAVVELWKRLSFSERQNFQFGVFFNNDNKDADGVSLMAVPDSIQSKFMKSDFFVIGKNDKYKPTELIEQLLIGDDLVRERIQNFEKTIECNPLSREDISLVAKGIETFEQINIAKDLKKLNTLAHIVAKYSPSNKQGVAFKSQLLNRIVQLAENIDFSDLIVLRNFKTESFKNSDIILSTSLIAWLKKYIFSKNGTDYTNFFERIKIDNLNWWDKAIIKELEMYLNSIQGQKATIVYNWLMQNPSILSIIDIYIDKSKESEKYFIEKLPNKIPDTLIKSLEEFSKNNLWLKLYAKLLDIQYEFKMALTELFKIDNNHIYFEAIDIITAGKDQKLIINYAVDTGEPRMIELSGKICNTHPKYLSKIEVLDDNWQVIWLGSIKNGNLVETGLKEPQKEIFKLFDSIVNGNSISEELIEIISQSKYGNILPYPNRTNLWNQLSLNVRNNFLTKTSAALLQQLSENSTTEIPDDAILTNYISKTGISDFLYFNRNNIKSVITIFEKFTQLSDEQLRNYINNFSGKINAIEATQLGKLVIRRNFTNSAYTINSKATKNNNWKYALIECHYLLDFITRGFLAISGVISKVSIPTDEWWQSVEELIVELYPNTSLTTIWKKAGGKEADLIMNTSAANTWSDVLYKLRRNHFKNLTMNDLLKEIKKQYGDNPKFKLIYDLRKNYIKT